MLTQIYKARLLHEERKIMKTIKQLCVQALTVLIPLLGTSQIALSQSKTLYSFTETEVKEIAYAIESRKLLMLDTADYISKIKNLEIKVSTTEEIVERVKSKEVAANTYIGVLKEDVDSLIIDRDLLIGRNQKLTKQNKLLSKAIPITVIISVITTILLTK